MEDAGADGGHGRRGAGERRRAVRRRRARDAGPRGLLASRRARRNGGRGRERTRGPGSYLGAPGLGAGGALSGDADTAARFDGVDDELQAGGAPVAGAATLEGWFFWEAGVALMRDATSSAGWILAYDSGGKVAYRVGGTTFTTALATASLRDGWHHVALTVAGGATSLYVDGVLVHSGSGAGARGGGDAVARHAQRHDGAVHARARRRGRGLRRPRWTRRRCAPTSRPAATSPTRPHRRRPPASSRPPASAASSSTGATCADADLDGYDVFRATSAGRAVRARQRVAPERVRVHRRVRRRRDDVLLRRHRERRRQQPQRPVGAGRPRRRRRSTTSCAATRRSCATRRRRPTSPTRRRR